MKWVVVLGLVLPLRVFGAEGCIDTWYTRNLVMDRVGYCFASPLGQALFDNSDCTTQAPMLTPEVAAFVAQLKALEAEHGCAVDTSQNWLDIPDMAFRKVLWDLPVRDELAGYACYGWLGDGAPLFYGHRPDAPQIGAILPGDTVFFEHVPAGGRSYVTVWQPPRFGAFKSAGWLTLGPDIGCAEEAG